MSESKEPIKPIKGITIEGLRGFKSKQTLKLGIPDNKTPGSGLTIIVGPNNGGKTTIVEAFTILSKNQISINKRKRNNTNNGKVKIEVYLNDGEPHVLENINNSSEILWDEKHQEGKPESFKIFTLDAKKAFPPEFSKNYTDRDQRNERMGYRAFRENEQTDFYGRLFQSNYKNKDRFNEDLSFVLNEKVEWNIDQNESGHYYLKFIYDDHEHSSDGIGHGYISLFMIIDSLYDAEPNSIIVIDEPELSLHPILHKNLFKLFLEHSKDKQIVIATHSSYFIDFNALVNGSVLHRVVKDGNNGSRIYTVSNDTIKNIEGFREQRNKRFPHILGLNAKEVFFLQDSIILTEGPDDVCGYQLLFDEVKKELLDLKEMDIENMFFGWGVGSKNNMDKICQLLKELGYKKVLGILDGDADAEKSDLNKKFRKSGYMFLSISTADIRDKEECKEELKIEFLSKELELSKKQIEKFENLNKKFFIKEYKEGIITKKYLFDEKKQKIYKAEVISLFKKIKKYFDN